jgi:hypothetical protein
MLELRTPGKTVEREKADRTVAVVVGRMVVADSEPELVGRNAAAERLMRKRAGLLVVADRQAVEHHKAPYSPVAAVVQQAGILGDPELQIDFEAVEAPAEAAVAVELAAAVVELAGPVPWHGTHNWDHSQPASQFWAFEPL